MENSEHLRSIAEAADDEDLEFRFKLTSIEGLKQSFKMEDRKKKDDYLDELIAQHKWKLALKEVENRLKKDSKSETLAIKKTIVLIESPTLAHQVAGRSQLEALLHRKPPITNLEALTTLDECLHGRAEYLHMVTSIWDRAAATQSSNGKFVQTWFLVSFQRDRWQAAQKAAMVWQKNFPQHRAPYYLYILCCHLISTCSASSENDRKLSRLLAHKFLMKAVDDAPPLPVYGTHLGVTRGLQTEEDLVLLLKVFTDQGRFSEAMRILESPRIGLTANTGRKSWEIARQMIIFYTTAEQWEGLWTTCYGILQFVPPKTVDPITGDSRFDFALLGDDWLVWDGFVTACAHLIGMLDKEAAKDRFKLTMGFIDAYCVGHKSRNARLAPIKFFSMTDVLNSVPDLASIVGEELGVQQVSSMCNYFQEYGYKVTCFRDLKDYLPALAQGRQEQFMANVTRLAEAVRPTPGVNNPIVNMNWVTTETNSMKFQYVIIIAKDKNIDKPKTVSDFVETCLRLYRYAIAFKFEMKPSDRRPGDDSALLAAMGFLRMYKMAYIEPEFRNSLLRCIVVLELALSKSQYNYDILLTLTRLYMALGAGSMAMRCYHQMGIKNLQHVTLSWVLYTRISRIHPHPTTVTAVDGKTKITIDPLEDMDKVIKWHAKAVELNFYSMTSLQDNHKWTILLDALDTKEALVKGFSRMLLLTESAAIRRLRYPDQPQFSSPQVEIPWTIKDIRDRSAFPNFEPFGQMTLEESLPSPSVPTAEPNARWLAAKLSVANLWGRLCDEGDDTVDFLSLAKLTNNSDRDHIASTSDELLQESLITDIIEVIAIADSAKSSRRWNPQLVEDFCGTLKEIRKKIEEAYGGKASLFVARGRGSDNFTHPSWAILHEFYIRLEVMQFVLKACSVVQAREKEMGLAMPKIMKELLAETTTYCKDRASALWIDATHFRAEVDETEFVEDLHYNILGRDVLGEMIRKMGLQALPVTPLEISIALQGSWLDAWDGILKTKIF